MNKKSTKRPDWDKFWFVQALMYSSRGTCDRLRTACVIVKNKRLAGAGYNGSPSGAPHCDDVGHLIIDGHCERTLHGEENAIINTAREDLVGATAYVIATPCIRCAKMLINAGVKEVRYLGEYHNSRGRGFIKDLAKYSKVKFTQYKWKPQDLISDVMQRLQRKGGALYEEKV